MNNAVRTQPVTADAVSTWLVEKIAERLTLGPGDIRTDVYFDEFGLDSTEALVLSAELEKWLGFELQTTALWYYPTIGELAVFIEETAKSKASALATAAK